MQFCGQCRQQHSRENLSQKMTGCLEDPNQTQVWSRDGGNWGVFRPLHARARRPTSWKLLSSPHLRVYFWMLLLKLTKLYDSYRVPQIIVLTAYPHVENLFLPNWPLLLPSHFLSSPHGPWLPGRSRRETALARGFAASTSSKEKMRRCKCDVHCVHFSESLNQVKELLFLSVC